MSEERRKKIVIVGGGFAGLELAQSLDSNIFDIWLIDRLNHHQFQPLFYQVATSQIEPSSISFPLRNVFKNKSNMQIRLAEARFIRTEKNVLETNIGDFSYDYLVLAQGCKTNFFGNQETESHCYTLKTTQDAIQIRNHIIRTFENIISAENDEKEALMNLVIVGAGPTGVELAGSFAEMKRYILPKDYPGIDFSKFKVIVIEGSPNPLNNLSDNAKKHARAYLEELGVDLRTETVVKNYDGTKLILSDGNFLNTKTVIWSAGVIGNKLEGLPSELYIANQRIQVDRTNRIKGLNNIFALGDIAYMVTPKYPKGHPQVANVALNQAKLLAKNLKRIELGEATEEYEYKDLGSMATIGKHKAVVDLPKWKFAGYFAWLIWMFLHLMLILGVRNKVIVFINWAWAYLTKDTSLRLILAPAEEKDIYVSKSNH